MKSDKIHKNNLIDYNKNNEISKLANPVNDAPTTENTIVYNALPAIPRVHMRLNTVENTRRSMAAVIRAVNRGDLTHEEGRSYGFLLQVLCSSFKTEQELNLTKQIRELKEMIQNAEFNGL